MIQKLQAPISVLLSSNHKTREVAPKKILFDGREYLIEKVGLHHTFRIGRTLFHVFSAASRDTFFRLVLNTDTLLWTVEEIHDGETG